MITLEDFEKDERFEKGMECRSSEWKFVGGWQVPSEVNEYFKKNAGYRERYQKIKRNDGTVYKEYYRRNPWKSPTSEMFEIKKDYLVVEFAPKDIPIYMNITFSNDKKNNEFAFVSAKIYSCFTHEEIGFVFASSYSNVDELHDGLKWMNKEKNSNAHI